MIALLLAAGFGTRLKPLTNNRPKCLMSICDKTLLQHWLDELFNRDIKKVFINSHYLSNQVENFVCNSIYKDKIEVFYEENLLGTAGTLVRNIDKFLSYNEDILVAHADNFFLGDFSNFFKLHLQRPRDCLITMLAFRTKKPRECGIIKLNKMNVLENFYEKVMEDYGDLASGACMIFSNESLSIIKRDFADAKDISLDIIPNFLKKIFVYEHESAYLDIGSPETLEYANKNLCNESLK